MKKSKTSDGILYLCLMILLLLLNGCKEPVNIQSKWLDKKIVIDANDFDWKDYPFFYDQKTLSCIGLYNDDKNLYLCFRTLDEDVQRQIMHQGLYIWFNKTGGKEKELALCFPEGGGFRGPGPGNRGGANGPPDRSKGMPNPPLDRASDIAGPPEGRAEYPNMHPGSPFSQGLSPDARISILTSEDDEGYNCSVERAARLGIEVKYTVDQQNRFIYELKMPLVETEKTAFYAEASPSNQIGIGFMTAKMEKKAPSDDMGRGGRGGDRSGGGMGGGMPGGGRGGGRPGGGMGGGPGGNMGGQGKSLEIWTNITLASRPADSQ